jgi:hypothetical protein
LRQTFRLKAALRWASMAAALRLVGRQMAVVLRRVFVLRSVAGQA